MSLNKVSPLARHTLSNVTKSPQSLNLSISQIALNVLASAYFSIKEGIHSQSFKERMQVVDLSTLQPDQQLVKVEIGPGFRALQQPSKVPPHVLMAKGYETVAIIRFIKSRPQKLAEKPGDLLKAEVKGKQVLDEKVLKAENIHLRRQLATLCGLHENTFDDAPVKVIVQHFVKNGLKNFDILDRFFEIEPFYHVAPSGRIRVKHILTDDRIQQIIKEVMQDLPKGLDYLDLSQEGRCLIFYRNLQRIEQLLDIKIDQAILREYKSAEEALASDPLQKLQKYLDYNVSKDTKSLITLLIDRFKNTFSAR